MLDLKPALEYVNGKNRLSACKFSVNIGIGKFEPVVDYCNTKKARVTNRPTLVKTENNIKEGMLAT